MWVRVKEAFLFTRGRLELDPSRDLNRYQRMLVTNLRALFMVFRWEVYQRVELHAQALTMKTLLSLVPAAAVFFAFLTAVDTQGQVREELVHEIIAYLSASEQLRDRVVDVLASDQLRHAELGALTIVILAFTVMSLLSHVENTFNALFEAKSARRLGVRLLSYWALLTVGPLLLLTSVALTAWFQSSAFAGFFDSLGALGRLALRMAPMGATWIAFALLYLTVPNTTVRLIPAMLAALVAGSLWNLAKWGFAFYASTNVTVQNIYGSLAAFPLFILWVYISWVLLLAGAQLCYAFQHADTYRPRHAEVPISDASREMAATRLLFEVVLGFTSGAAATTLDALSKRLDMDPRLAQQAMDRLRDAKLVVHADEGGLVPARDPSEITVGEVLEHLRFPTGEPPRLPRDEATALLTSVCAVPNPNAEVNFRELVERYHGRRHDVPSEGNGSSRRGAGGEPAQPPS